MDYAKLSALILIGLLILGALIGIWVYSASERLLERESEVEYLDLALVNGNTLVAISPISLHEGKTYAIISADYQHILDRYDWDSDKMAAVMFCESSNNPKAYNPEQHNGCQGSYGLMQIACVHSQYVDELDDLLNPRINIEVAYLVWQNQGWRAWENCW